VRQAVGYAINRKDVVQGAFGGRGSALAGLPIPASSPFHSDDPALKWSYDPAKAKALLAKAGAAEGFTCDFVTYGNPVHQDPAMVALQNLAAIGINAQMHVVDWPTRIQLGTEKGFARARVCFRALIPVHGCDLGAVYSRRRPEAASKICSRLSTICNRIVCPKSIFTLRSTLAMTRTGPMLAVINWASPVSSTA
jgi:hypothetical protein